MVRRTINLFKLKSVFLTFHVLSLSMFFKRIHLLSVEDCTRNILLCYYIWRHYMTRTRITLPLGPVVMKFMTGEDFAPLLHVCSLVEFCMFLYRVKRAHCIRNFKDIYIPYWGVNVYRTISISITTQCQNNNHIDIAMACLTCLTTFTCNVDTTFPV